MRPFYAVVIFHCLASYLMLAAVFVLVERSGLRQLRLDGQDVLLVLSPLYTWYVLFESLQRATIHPREAVIAWARDGAGMTVDKERGRETLPDDPRISAFVRCSAETRDGRNCKAPACAGDTRCRWHGGRRRIPKVCRCSAYAWPHRPGSGKCRFHEPPDPPGTFVYSYSPPAGRNKPIGLRRRGWWRYVQQYHRLHPIRDRKRIQDMVELLQGRPWLRYDEVGLWNPDLTARDTTVPGGDHPGITNIKYD